MPKYIYAVYESGDGEAVVERAVVVKETPKQWRLSGLANRNINTGLAFNCVTVCVPGAFSSTPEEAVEKWRTSLKVRRESLTKRLQRVADLLALDSVPNLWDLEEKYGSGRKE